MWIVKKTTDMPEQLGQPPVALDLVVLAVGL